MTPYQLFDTIRTLEPISLSGKILPAGTMGTVVEIFHQPQFGLMIEFDEDKALILPVLQPQQVELVGGVLKSMLHFAEFLTNTAFYQQ